MKSLNVFYDIETLTVNRSAKPTQQQPIEYVVTVIFENDKVYYYDFPNLKTFIEFLIDMPKVKNFNLIAHNGDRYDGHFLRYSLTNDFGLVAHTGYNRNSVSHDDELTLKDIHGDYLLENRVKSRTNLSMRFNIKNNKFKTTDTLPKFQCSIATMGELLEHHNIISKSDMKLDDYDYLRFDKSNDYDYFSLRKYALNVFDGLTEHDYQYIHNDVYIMYMGWKFYNTIFPNFDIAKTTLSQNILTAYEVNTLSTFQLLNKTPDVNINYSDYEFDGDNLYTYVHRYYKGGLNYYNDNYVGKSVKGVKHVDKNSSYPFVMSTKKFPTFLMEGKLLNDKLVFDDNYYYMVKISKATFNMIIGKIKSIQIRKMLVKYFNNSTNFVYLSTPHIELISEFVKKPIKSLPVVSYLKWATRVFGAHEVIDQLYKIKTDNKIAGFSDKAIYVDKVKMNGIYGIPALRAFFNQFKINDDNELYNSINDFKNNERNLVFASAVTSYSFYTLMHPLTFNVAGVDDGFVYCDTDSLFLKVDYYDSIVDHMFIDKYDLAAWKVEHDYIDEMYVLNHKKYALIANGKIDVRCGGVPLDSFNLNMDFKTFIATQFSKGAHLNVKKGVFTKNLTPVLYEADTVIDVGGQYDTMYSDDTTMMYNMALVNIVSREISDYETDGEADGLYYESEFGAIAISEAFPYTFKNETFNLNMLLQQYSILEEIL